LETQRPAEGAAVFRGWGNAGAGSPLRVGGNNGNRKSSEKREALDECGKRIKCGVWIKEEEPGTLP